MSDPDPASLCESCLVRPPMAADRLCEACLLRAGLEDTLAQEIGEYAVWPAMTEGGTATIHLAQRSTEPDLVVVKLAKSEVSACPSSKAAFWHGIRVQRKLTHPRNRNSVPVLECGEHAGTPYVVMPLYEEGTLAEPRNRARFREPGAALEALLKIARAVEFAHERGIMHCDLKPANILLDASAEPFVSDFGMARVFSQSDPQPHIGFFGGTSGWMAPEQVDDAELTLATDVFSLGALLYWMLTGRMPFGRPPEGQHAAYDALRLPGALVRGVPADLDKVCSRALRRDAAQRYGSATELVRDLERVRDGHPIAEESHLRRRRLQKWIGRNKLLAVLLAQLAALLVYLSVMPLSVLSELTSSIQRQNGVNAVLRAEKVAAGVRAFADQAVDLASAPEVVAVLSLATDEPVEIPAPNPRYEFDHIFVFHTDGSLAAAWPPIGQALMQQNFAFRDYFRGQAALAAAHRREAYVSRAFRSYTDGELSLGFAAPVYDATGEPCGAVVGTTKTRDRFRDVPMTCGGSGECKLALLGARDRDRAAQPLPESLSVLAEAGLARGADVVVDARTQRELCARLPCERAPLAVATGTRPPTGPRMIALDYRDPLSAVPAVGGAAPVDDTGLIVLVATSNDVIVGVSERIRERAIAYAWLPFSLGLLFVLGLASRSPSPLRWPRGPRGPREPGGSRPRVEA